MRARDTVMSEEKIKEIWYGVISTADKLPKIPDLVPVVAEAQAEISFKAGYEQGVENHHECCKMDYKAGIQEVVDAVDNLLIPTSEAVNTLPNFYLRETDWQAFKKGKGIG